jgi:AbrB family looped-hinge helix DNA binding protein
MSGTHIAESRVTSKSQITLPKKVKEMLKVDKGDYVLFFKDEHRIFIEAGRLTAKSRK